MMATMLFVNRKPDIPPKECNIFGIPSAEIEVSHREPRARVENGKLVRRNIAVWSRCPFVCVENKGNFIIFEDHVLFLPNA